MMLPLPEVVLDPFKSMVLNTDVKTLLVKNVLHNVLLVPEKLTIVNSVPPEELTHQLVLALLVNTLMLTTLVKTVTSNVKLVLTMMNVLNVLTNPTELLQVNVNVYQDIMKLILLSVQFVTTNVLPVLNMKSVLNVMLTESTHHTVHVNLTGMKTQVSVNHVPTNVNHVETIKKNVTIVPVTELMPQLVTVHQDTLKIMFLKLVQNVTVNVPLVETT